MDRFYEKFLASSPEIRAKFANTDFVKQKEALRGSLTAMMRAAADEATGPETYLKDLAILHGRSHLDIGAGLYDLWLDSLLATVRECDPQFDVQVQEAWESVMEVGIRYIVSLDHTPPEKAG